jgi:hypothetical protein
VTHRRARRVGAAKEARRPPSPVVAQRRPSPAIPCRPCLSGPSLSPLPFLLGGLFSSAVAARLVLVLLCCLLVPEDPPRRPFKYRWTRRSRRKLFNPRPALLHNRAVACGGLAPPSPSSESFLDRRRRAWVQIRGYFFGGNWWVMNGLKKGQIFTRRVENLPNGVDNIYYTWSK